MSEPQACFARSNSEGPRLSLSTPFVHVCSVYQYIRLVYVAEHYPEDSHTQPSNRPVAAAAYVFFLLVFIGVVFRDMGLYIS